MALIPVGYLKAIVSLGVSEQAFRHLGTGFLYHHPLWTKDNHTRYRPFLITNKHVVDDGVSDIRFNRLPDGSLAIQSIASVTVGTWTVHPNGADVAVKPVLSPGALTVGRDVFEGEIFLGDVGTPSDEEANHIVEGNGGFSCWDSHWV